MNYPCEKEALESVLPHRDPFLWVTRVLSCEPGLRATAQLDVSEDLPLFAGHFPGHPVLPGVILMEALAQTACFCLLVEGAHGSVGFLTGIDKAKFRRQVAPGDTVRLEAEIIKRGSRMCVAQVSAFVGEDLCASAEQRYVLSRSTEAPR